MRRLLISSLSLVTLLSAQTATGATTPVKSCEEVLVTQPVNKKGQTIEVVEVWNDLHRKTFKRMGAVNGLLVDVISNFFKSKNRFPLEYEIVKGLTKAISAKDLKGAMSPENNNLVATIASNGLKAYFAMDGAADNLLALYTLAVSQLPDIYGPFRMNVAKRVAKYYSSHLRTPSYAELAEQLGIVQNHLKIVLGDPTEFMSFTEQNNATEFMKAKDRLAKGFLESMRQSDRPQRQRTRSSTPDLQGLLDSLGRLKGSDDLKMDIQSGRFTLRDLNELLGTNKPLKKDLPRKPIFAGGVDELENYTRDINPNAFQNHLSSQFLSRERQELLVQKIESSRGIIVASYGANSKIEEHQLAAMLAYAEDRDFIIVLMPELGILDGVDPRFLESDRIFLLTHTIQNKALRLWNIPITAKQVRPFSGLDLSRNTVDGQLTIIGSPQQAMTTLPRPGADITETTLWTPGSISAGVYNYRLAIQGRTAYLAEGRHSNGFLVLEKANSDSGKLKLGATNTWIPRNVQVTLTQDKGATGDVVTSGAYFDDLGSLYGHDDSGPFKMKKGASALVLGDLHDAKTLQSIMPHIKSYIAQNPDLEVVVLHDPMDGNSHNHHEKDRLISLAKKLRTGQLDMLQEYLDLVQTVNSLLQIRDDLKVVMVDSNHSYWAKNLLENTIPMQQVINGEFIAEVRYAMTRSANPARDPLHYVFDKLGRELTLSRMSPDELRQTPGSNIRLMDADRVQVLKSGSMLTIGTEANPVDLQNHGHKGANGAKGSTRAHAAYGGNSTGGDSHRKEIYLGYFNAGTTTEKNLDYNSGGYSAWGHGATLVYPDGAMQLIGYNEIADSFQQDPKGPILEGKTFFGDDPLTIVPNSNERFDGAYKVDQYSPRSRDRQ